MGSEKSKKSPFTTVLSSSLLFFLVFSATFQGCFSAANQAQTKKKQTQSRFGSSAVFPVSGNVYPDGVYTVSLNVGNRREPYVLDIDTGSDLSWLQCDAPCVRCTKAAQYLYKPNKNLIMCSEPLCTDLQRHTKNPCKTPDDQCDYEVGYADRSSSLGVLVRDSFPLRFTNGSRTSPQLAFGCGYDQQFSTAFHSHLDGVLGLGIGKSSIISQLHDLGLTRNVLGHCLSGKGGFLFFGDDIIPSSGVVWAPISRNSLDKHYSLGSAELLFGGKSTGVKNHIMVFDSGSSYTYFTDKAYQATLSMIKKGLSEKPLNAVDDGALPICWKGAKPFKSVHDVKNYFKPLTISFTKAKNAQLQIPPEAYLIVTKHGNVCLGILNGSEMGLEDFNIIGNIFLQDKIVIYDNENHQIGWIPANCDRLPNVDLDRDSNELFAANLGILADHYASLEEL